MTRCWSVTPRSGVCRLARAGLWTVAAIAGCLRDPASFAPHDIRYDVWIPSPGGDSLHVRMTIEQWNVGDSVRLLFAPVYADNPVLARDGELVRNLLFTDDAGAELPHVGDSVWVGNFPSYAAAFSCRRLPVRVEYDVVFSFVDSLTQGMAAPRLSARSGFLTGAYIFAVPYTVADPVRIWRDPWDLAVTYHAGSGWAIYGDPQPSAAYATPYELLFAMSAVVRSEEAAARVLTGPEAAGQAFRFVRIGDPAQPAPQAMAVAVADFSVLLADIVSVFGRLKDSPITVILGSGMGGGLEGMHAFTILDPFGDDTLGVFNTVAAHEAVHFWVGVRTGDEDLPWWKEGTTTYLGYLFAVRNGLCRRAYVEEGLLQNLDTLPAVRQYALNDPAIRANIYTPGPGFYELVYLKGGQVTMLLDRAVRAASGNVVSIDKIIGRLCADHRSGAFTRRQYVDAIRRLSGAAVEEILARYADAPGAIADAALLDNYHALAAMGAFGPPVQAAMPRIRLFNPATLPPFMPKSME